MSRSFIGFPSQLYKLQLIALPAETSNNGFGNQSRLPPTMVQAVFPWLTYGASSTKPNVSALVSNINAGAGSRQLLDRIRSVRIDNLGVPVPVFVSFPDINYTVVAPPNSVVWDVVRTGQFNATVTVEGFTTATLNTSPTTTVYFCNFDVVPFIDQEVNSSQSQRLSTANIATQPFFQGNFGVPALGDVPLGFNFNVNANTSFSISANFDRTAAFLYITEFAVFVTSPIIAGAAGFKGDITLLSITPGGETIFDIGISLIANATQQPGLLFRMPGQFKLDNTQTWIIAWNISAGAGSGLVSCGIAATQNPN